MAFAYLNVQFWIHNVLSYAKFLQVTPPVAMDATPTNFTIFFLVIPSAPIARSLKFPRSPKRSPVETVIFGELRREKRHEQFQGPSAKNQAFFPALTRAQRALAAAAIFALAAALIVNFFFAAGTMTVAG